MKRFLAFLICFAAIPLFATDNTFGTFTLQVQNNSSNAWTGCGGVLVIYRNDVTTCSGTPTSGKTANASYNGGSGGLAAGSTFTWNGQGLVQTVTFGCTGASGYLTLEQNGVVLWTGPIVTYNATAGNTSSDAGAVALNPGAGCAFVATNTPTISTNYTSCANNTDKTRSMNAVWTYNGSVVKTSVIQPGGSDCYTTPSIQLSPIHQSFTLNLTTTFNTFGSPITEGTNGTITFTPPVAGGGGSTNTTQSNPAGTNTYVPPVPTATAAPTNIVTFTTPTGSASESTLNQGFQLLHQDNINSLAGQSILNNSINNGFMMTTNQAGQQIALLYSNVNIDGQWLPQIYGAVTNLNHSLTNQALVSNSSTNVYVTDEPTNILAGMDSNVITANSWLAQIYSNTIPQTNNFDTNLPNAQAAAGVAAAAAGSNSLVNLTAGLPSTAADDSDAAEGANLATWSVSIPYGSGYTINLNPFSQSWVVSLAAFCRNFIKWAALISLVTIAGRMVLASIAASGSNRQATSANGVPVVESVTAFVCAGLITLVSAGFIAFSLLWFAHYMTSIGTSPLASVSGVETAVWIVDHFFPLAVIVSCSFSLIIFNWILTAVVWGVQKVTLFITG